MGNAYKSHSSLSLPFHSVDQFDPDAEPPMTLSSAYDRLLCARSNGNPKSYAIACDRIFVLLCESSDSELENLFHSDFVSFLSEQIRPQSSPTELCSALLVLSGILFSSNPMYAQKLLELGVLDPLNELLSVEDSQVVFRVLTCMAYASNGFAQAQIDYRFAIGSVVLEEIMGKWPQLKKFCLQLTPYFLGVTVVDDYSIDLLRFLMVHFEPECAANDVFPVLIGWVKRCRDFPYSLLVDTGFLSKTLRWYVNPRGRHTSTDIRVRQRWSIRMLRVCVREFAEFREKCHELIRPGDIFAVVNDLRNDDVIVAAGLKLMAELCRCEEMERLVEAHDVATVMDRVLQTGTYLLRVNCWRWARVWIEHASPEAREFLLEEDLLTQAAEQIDRDTPKLALILIEFLIAASKVETKGLMRTLGTKELVESLFGVEEGHPGTSLSERAMELIEILKRSK
jgi:hypothetical protein